MILIGSVEVKVLVACEESQRVCTEFRNLGHEAYSNDVQKCSGEHPEWHILMDARSVLGGGCDEIAEWQEGHD